MKDIKKTLLSFLIVLALLMSGCANFLDVTSDKELSDQNALETLGDYDMATIAVYEAMRSTYYLRACLNFPQ